MHDHNESAPPPVPSETHPGTGDPQPPVVEDLGLPEATAAADPEWTLSPPEVSPLPVSEIAPMAPATETWPPPGSTSDATAVAAGAAVTSAQQIAVLRAELVA